MKKAILVTLLTSTLGLGAAAVHADDNDSGKRGGQGYSKHEGGKHAGKRGGRHDGNMMKRMAKKLNLTEAQQTQIKTFREAQKEQHQALRTQKQALRTEMKALDTTSTDYQSQVAVIADKRANLDRQEFIQRSASRQQFESVLTAKQRVTLKEMKENRVGKRGGKRHGKHNAE